MLDFGCGPGRDLKVLAELGQIPVGLKGAARFAGMARAHLITGYSKFKLSNTQGGFVNTFTFSEMLAHLLRRHDQSRAARTVEIFGWLMLIESLAILFAPNAVAGLLQLAPLSDQATIYFRIGGLLIGGLGMLYVVSGRLSANGFIFASMLDRPLVPPMMAVLWYLNIVPGTLAIAFSILDGSSFLWTLCAWRADLRASAKTAAS